MCSIYGNNFAYNKLSHKLHQLSIKMEDVTAMTITVLQMLDDSDDEFSSSSSSSSRTDSELQDYLDVAETLVCCQRRKRPLVKSYCDEVVPSYSEKEFITQFRISRKVMNSVVQRFTDSDLYQSLILPGTRASISAVKHILSFLWFAGHQTSTFRDASIKFGVSISSMHDIITRVIAFLSALTVDEICRPTLQQRAQTMAHYDQAKGFPNIVGLIGVSHIKLDKPTPISNMDYMNRHGYPSMVLQGICNEECRFLDIFVELPGSALDEQVLDISPVYKSLEQFCKGGYLLGHSAYSTMDTILTPYHGTEVLTDDEKLFNAIHSSCHISIEQAFYMLKQRFRQLYQLKIKRYERICNFIKACCVLHNLADKEDLDIFIEEANPIDDQPLPNEIIKESANNQLRDEIKHQLSLRRTSYSV